jgi:hypothetical protein
MLLFAELNSNAQVKEDEMDRACNTNGEKIGMRIGYWWESQKEKDH